MPIHHFKGANCGYGYDNYDHCLWLLSKCLRCLIVELSMNLGDDLSLFVPI